MGLFFDKVDYLGSAKIGVRLLKVNSNAARVCVVACLCTEDGSVLHRTCGQSPLGTSSRLEGLYGNAVVGPYHSTTLGWSAGSPQLALAERRGTGRTKKNSEPFFTLICN